MAWFGVYLSLVLLNVLANLVCVPWEHLRTYSEGSKPWDYYVSALLHVSLPVVAWRTAGDFSVPVRLVGIACYISASCLWIWVRRVNPHFVAEVRRPERVITTGPYRLRHPGYLALAGSSFGTVCILGSSYAFIPMICLWLLLFRRAIQEDELLKETR